MVTYEQWNKATISYFFENREPGEIVFLQTDADTLSEIAERSNFDVADAPESLKEAVRNKMVHYDSVNLWAVNPSTANLLWNDSAEEEPPQVAFLALTVLAASLMGSEGSVGSQNYYIRLNELLFGQSVKGAPQGFHRPKFEDFWKQFRGWLRDYYDVELYLTEGSSTRRYVWYPISQYLININDRRSIYCFFRDYDLTPFSEISDNKLEKDLHNWARSSGFTRIERYFSNESYKELIVSQVKSLLRHWDNEIPPDLSRGKKQTTAKISVELRFDPFENNVEIRYWLPTRSRDETKCKTNALGVKFLQSSHLEKWFRPIIDNSRTFWSLQNRLQVQTDETNPIIYTLSFSDIWVFREDSERDDGWLSQRNMQLHGNHLIVFRKQFAKQVMGCLRKTCGQEIEKPNPIYVDGEKHDWLYLRAKPIESKVFSQQDFWKLSVVSGERISLTGGLSVRDRNGRKVYLDICLPTVFVPNLGLSDQQPLEIDEQSFPIGEDRLVILDNALESGFHLLTYGRQKRELRIISLERSLEHHKQTLIATIPEDQTILPAYARKEISKISEEPGIWLTGAKFFGNILLPPPSIDNEFSKAPAHIISSVVKVAINFKKGNTSVPEWFDEAIEYLEQNVGLQAMVEKKLNLYHETALSYVELRKQIGK